MTRVPLPLQVLDASALLAFLQDEPGAENVRLEGAVMNSVNYSEVVQKSMAKNKAVTDLLEELRLLGLEVTAFTPEEGVVAAELYGTARRSGLSLADRACLATAKYLHGMAVTADHAWDDIDLGVPVKVIR